MKYIVRKSWFAAKEGEILIKGEDGCLHCITDGKPDYDFEPAVSNYDAGKALDQGFIEPYEEKPKRWRAVTGEGFYTVDLSNGTFTSCMYYHYLNGSADTYYENLNYFKSLETTKAVLEALRLFFEYLHTIPGTPQQNIKNQFEAAHAKARKLVLADNEVSK